MILGHATKKKLYTVNGGEIILQWLRLWWLNKGHFVNTFLFGSPTFFRAFVLFCHGLCRLCVARFVLGVFGLAGGHLGHGRVVGRLWLRGSQNMSFSKVFLSTRCLRETSDVALTSLKPSPQRRRLRPDSFSSMPRWYCISRRSLICSSSVPAEHTVVTARARMPHIRTRRELRGGRAVWKKTKQKYVLVAPDAEVVSTFCATSSSSASNAAFLYLWSLLWYVNNQITEKITFLHIFWHVT